MRYEYLLYKRNQRNSEYKNNYLKSVDTVLNNGLFNEDINYILYSSDGSQKLFDYISNNPISVFESDIVLNKVRNLIIEQGDKPVFNIWKDIEQKLLSTFNEEVELLNIAYAYCENIDAYITDFHRLINNKIDPVNFYYNYENAAIPDLLKLQLSGRSEFKVLSPTIIEGKSSDIESLIIYEKIFNYIYQNDELKNKLISEGIIHNYYKSSIEQTLKSLDLDNIVQNILESGLILEKDSIINSRKDDIKKYALYNAMVNESVYKIKNYDLIRGKHLTLDKIIESLDRVTNLINEDVWDLAQGTSNSHSYKKGFVPKYLKNHYTGLKENDNFEDDQNNSDNPDNSEWINPTDKMVDKLDEIKKDPPKNSAELKDDIEDVENDKDLSNKEKKQIVYNIVNNYNNSFNKSQKKVNNSRTNSHDINAKDSFNKHTHADKTINHIKSHNNNNSFSDEEFDLDNEFDDDENDNISKSKKITVKKSTDNKDIDEAFEVLLKNNLVILLEAENPPEIEVNDTASYNASLNDNPSSSKSVTERIRDKALDVDVATNAATQKAVKGVKDIDAAGKAIMRTPKKILSAFSKLINDIKNNKEQSIKEQLLDGNMRYKIWDTLKMLLVVGIPASLGAPLIAAALGILMVPIGLYNWATGSDFGNGKIGQYRAELINELKTELAIVKDKIDNAPNQKEKHAQMRIYNQLNAEYGKLIKKNPYKYAQKGDIIH